MRDIATLSVRQVRLYEPDIIPFRFLRTKLGIDFIMNQFQFKEHAVPDGSEIYFTGGAYTTGSTAEDPVIPITLVSVNERRIIIDVAGPSAWANLVFEALRANVASMDLERRLNTREPLVIAHETSCTATMEFGWQELLAVPLVHFLAGPAMSAMESEISTPRLSSMSLKFTISFTSPDTRLADTGITLSDKTLTIEPRVNTPLEDQHFFTVSPLESDAHLALLSELEQAIVARRGGRRRKAPPAA
jgi:hypothetical protein